MEIIWSTLACLLFIFVAFIVANFLSRRFAKAGIAEFLIKLFQNRTRKKK